MRVPKRAAIIAMSSLAVIALAGGAFAYRTSQTHAATAAAGTGAPGTVSRAHTTIGHNIQFSPKWLACLGDSPEFATSSSACPAHPDDRAPRAGIRFNSKGSTVGASHAPHIAAGTQLSLAPRLSTNVSSGGQFLGFDGLNDHTNKAVDGYHDTPPDQALCVGQAGAIEATVPLAGNPSATTSVVVEGVNSMWAVYGTNGALLFGPDNLTDLFSDPGASGDITCHYDPSTKAFYFGEIGVLFSGPDAGNYGTDLAVLDAHGYAAYAVDTSFNADCFPDFPQQGFDNSAFYLTINEFCGVAQNFAGAAVWAMSKSQLVNLGATVNFVRFGPLAVSGDPVLTLQPAFGGVPGTEYLVNSFPYDKFGNSNAVANSLGVFKVVGDQQIVSHPSAVTIVGHGIVSESYAFPMPAASTGDGSTPAGAAPYVIKEPFLNPDDSRLEQVQYVPTANGPRLYTSLDTALTVGNDPTAVDGAAWFVVDPVNLAVTNQGYVGAANTYLLYPSLLRSNTDHLVLDFSLTGKNRNPSEGYTTMNEATGSGWSQIWVWGGGGHYAHQSFSDLLFGRGRWGDYSAIAMDPASGNVWFADEYIPTAPAGTDLVDNWGTRVVGVAG